MFRSKWVPLAAVALLSGSVLVFAEDAAPATAPTEHHHGRAGKLTKPWSELTGLTDDQKSKILAVHTKAVEEVKAIHEKEKEDIMAVLTDDQKKEAEEMESKSGHKGAEAETQPAK